MPGFSLAWLKIPWIKYSIVIIMGILLMEGKTYTTTSGKHVVYTWGN
jgi:hypothetical protein